VQHSIARGPAKGGIRYRPDTSRTMKSARWRHDDLECAVNQPPLRRRKGGVICDPNVLPPSNWSASRAAYTAEIFEFIGPEKDVPRPT